LNPAGAGGPCGPAPLSGAGAGDHGGSSNAARLFGLERKGKIAPGFDADLVLFDPDLTRTVDSSMLKSNADYSVYEGWEITGWPVLTISCGEIVFQDDRVIGQAGRGQIVRRSSPEML
jgi:dihydropyrimidinase